MNRETEEAKSFLRLAWHFILFIGSCTAALYLAGLLLFDLLFFRNWFVIGVTVVLLPFSIWVAWTSLKGLFRQ
jgi:hypothetical protein